MSMLASLRFTARLAAADPHHSTLIAADEYLSSILTATASGGTFRRALARQLSPSRDRDHGCSSAPSGSTAAADTPLRQYGSNSSTSNGSNTPTGVFRKLRLLSLSPHSSKTSSLNSLPNVKGLIKPRTPVSCSPTGSRSSSRRASREVLPAVEDTTGALVDIRLGQDRHHSARRGEDLLSPRLDRKTSPEAASAPAWAVTESGAEPAGVLLFNHHHHHHHHHDHHHLQQQQQVPSQPEQPLEPQASPITVCEAATISNPDEPLSLNEFLRETCLREASASIGSATSPRPLSPYQDANSPSQAKAGRQRPNLSISIAPKVPVPPKMAAPMAPRAMITDDVSTTLQQRSPLSSPRHRAGHTLVPLRTPPSDSSVVGPQLWRQGVNEPSELELLTLKQWLRESRPRKPSVNPDHLSKLQQYLSQRKKRRQQAQSGWRRSSVCEPVSPIPGLSQALEAYQICAINEAIAAASSCKNDHDHNMESADAKAASSQPPLQATPIPQVDFTSRSIASESIDQSQGMRVQASDAAEQPVGRLPGQCDSSSQLATVVASTYSVLPSAGLHAPTPRGAELQVAQPASHQYHRRARSCLQKASLDARSSSLITLSQFLNESKPAVKTLSPRPPAQRVVSPSSTEAPAAVIVQTSVFAPRSSTPVPLQSQLDGTRDRVLEPSQGLASQGDHMLDSGSVPTVSSDDGINRAGAPLPPAGGANDDDGDEDDSSDDSDHASDTSSDWWDGTGGAKARDPSHSTARRRSVAQTPFSSSAGLPVFLTTKGAIEALSSERSPQTLQQQQQLVGGDGDGVPRYMMSDDPKSTETNANQLGSLTGDKEEQLNIRVVKPELTRLSHGDISNSLNQMTAPIVIKPLTVETDFDGNDQQSISAMRPSPSKLMSPLRSRVLLLSGPSASRKQLYIEHNSDRHDDDAADEVTSGYGTMLMTLSPSSHRRVASNPEPGTVDDNSSDDDSEQSVGEHDDGDHGGDGNTVSPSHAARASLNPSSKRSSQRLSSTVPARIGSPMIAGLRKTLAQELGQKSRADQRGSGTGHRSGRHSPALSSIAPYATQQSASSTKLAGVSASNSSSQQQQYDSSVWDMEPCSPLSGRSFPCRQSSHGGSSLSIGVTARTGFGSRGSLAECALSETGTVVSAGKDDDQDEDRARRILHAYRAKQLGSGGLIRSASSEVME